MHLDHLFASVWIAWALLWAVGAFWTNPTVRRAASVQAWAYRAVAAAGFVLLWPQWTIRALGARPIWNVGLYGGWLLAAFTFAGLLFACWARWHLGRLWSGAITRKQGHHIVNTGPYAIVRHPIYTGLIAAALTTALASATAAALAGFVLVAVGFWLKARAEERFLAAEFGAERYAIYQRRVPMLVPFAPHRS